MGKKIVTPQILEDKIEGLLMASKATVDQETLTQIETDIKDYAHQYKELTGNWYIRSYE